MALPLEQVEAILAGRGRILVDRSNEPVARSHDIRTSPEMYGQGGDANYFVCRAVVGTGQLKFFTLEGMGSVVNAISVAYFGDMFTIGKLKAPGYIHSDGFAGCSFYLYRGMDHELWGVHASREAGKVKDPEQYFTARGFKLLWQWNSFEKQSATQLNAGNFAAVLCCVDLEEIRCYAMSMQGDVVDAILDGTTINNWRRFERAHMTPPSSLAPVYVAPVYRATRLQRLARAVGL